MSAFKNEHLNDVLESHRMKHIDDKMKKYLQKRDKVKDSLQDKYEQKIVVRAINSGSYVKYTAVNTKFDIDICQPFKRDIFQTLEEMADDVYEFFKKEYRDNELIEIKKQRDRKSVV